MSIENEKHLIESFLNLDDNVANVQEYIKENYNIESEYDAANDTIYLWANSINESLNLAAAKEYIEEEIGNEMISIILCKKQ